MKNQTTESSALKSFYTSIESGVRSTGSPVSPFFALPKARSKKLVACLEKWEKDHLLSTATAENSITFFKIISEQKDIKPPYLYASIKDDWLSFSWDTKTAKIVATEAPNVTLLKTFATTKTHGTFLRLSNNLLNDSKKYLLEQAKCTPIEKNFTLKYAYANEKPIFLTFTEEEVIFSKHIDT